MYGVKIIADPVRCIQINWYGVFKLYGVLIGVCIVRCIAYFGVLIGVGIVRCIAYFGALIGEGNNVSAN